MSIAFVFPGQGSQAVGMGAGLAEAFPAAKAVFDEVDESLGQPLSKLMWEGPEADLTLTENAQPALMAVSLAAMRALEATGFVLGDKVAYVAGHSLGEYSALAASGALSLADTARLLKVRGRAMQQAVPVGEGAMAALLGADLAQAQELAAAASEGECCQAANDNAPGQVVISGKKTAIERAVELAPKFGARRAVLLPVSAPFHCALMQPAADAMAEALSGVTISAPAVPVVANVLAEPISDPEAIRTRLVEQVTGMVRWRETMAFLAGNGVDTVYEVGAGRVLTGMARRLDGVEARSVGTPEELESAAAALNG
ncbi:MAG: ACP S-malonyltransferase [Methyloceanibacter sp.]|uniref:ACP S-malonyltransferase n=1 Tax=Methyloceanibacter sp. TaxID=1965321 RepID=UPI001DD3D8C4|nr:ACP S-malonyltransferase [Methyloceanibacter sp.]MCB1442908.1 ACP S-malonyltransferase [Methyloceanibacter sp.]